MLLQPALQWADKADFNDTLTQLAGLFENNFKVGKGLAPAVHAEHFATCITCINLL